jgi:hypothetical protein
MSIESNTLIATRPESAACDRPRAAEKLPNPGAKLQDAVLRDREAFSDPRALPRVPKRRVVGAQESAYGECRFP